ncbi:MAG TPA: PLP-dependent aminotransferase family protein, partial [Streptomyces sp.]
MLEKWTSSVGEGPGAAGADLHLEVDTRGGRRAGLERALREAVQGGRLAPGAALPSTRSLAAELGLSRGTVTAAYDQLAAEGYLVTRPGAATTVAGPARAPDAPGTVRPTAVASRPRHDLRPNTPDASAFPARAWLRATRRVLTDQAAEVQALGDPQGHPALRAALADYLGRARGVRTTADRVVITTGFHQSLGLLARTLADAGTTAIALEDPGHNGHREAVARAGLRVLPLPVDGHGARVDTLASGDAGAVLVTPAHQYPTGVPLHPARRQALTAWACGRGALVIEDDYDGEYRYDRQPVGALQAIDPDRVVYCGSASKTLGPGWRLAWMALPPHLVEPVVTAKFHADVHTQTLSQLVLADLLSRHDYDRHIRAGRLRYRRRRELLLRSLPPGLTVQGTAAGLYALATLPADGPTEPALLAEC